MEVVLGGDVCFGGGEVNVFVYFCVLVFVAPPVTLNCQQRAFKVFYCIFIYVLIDTKS